MDDIQITKAEIGEVLITKGEKLKVLLGRKWVIAFLLLIVTLLSTFLDDFIAPWGIPIVVILIFALYLIGKVPMKKLGLYKPGSWSKTILMGTGAGIFIHLFGSYILSPIVGFFGVPQETPEFYAQIEGNHQMFLLYMIVTWTSAGFGEEIIYRAFFLDQCSKFFQNEKFKWIISLVISSIFFGFLHYNNGVDAIIVTGINGFIIGLVYILNERNIWGAYLAHGVANSIAFLLIYTGV